MSGFDQLGIDDAIFTSIPIIMGIVLVVLLSIFLIQTGMDVNDIETNLEKSAYKIKENFVRELKRFDLNQFTWHHLLREVVGKMEGPFKPLWEMYFFYIKINLND